MLRRYAEFRADGNVIEGVAIRYGDVARIGSFRERFEPGSVHFDDVVLNLQHNRERPIARTGAGLTLTDSPERLHLRAELPDTRYGKLARELVDAKLLRGLSVEFEPEIEDWQGTTRIVRQARLWGVGLVDRPAYSDSTLARHDGAAGRVELRGPEISGVIKLGVPGVVSGAAGRSVQLEPDAISDPNEMPVFLLDGFDYNRAVASSGAGSLTVEKTKDEIRFSTKRLSASVPAVKNARARLRQGLVNGVVPGVMRIESETVEQDDGGTLEIIRKARLCELNLVAREGLGPANIARGRRRRWLL